MEANIENNQNEPQGGVTLFKNALVYGLLTGGAYILASLLFYSLDVDPGSKVQYLTFLILIAGIIMGIKQFRDKHSGGFLSYVRCLGTGVVISVVVGIIMAIYVYLFFSYFDPGQLEKMAEMAEQRLVDQGLTDEQIDQAMVMTRKFMNPVFSAIMSIFSMAFWGTIISLIVSIFLKKNDESFDGAFNQ